MCRRSSHCSSSSFPTGSSKRFEMNTLWHSLMIIIFTGLVLLSTTRTVEAEEVRMSTYFPEVVDDPSGLRWAHAVNTREALRIAGEGDADMIEADVSFGTVSGGRGDKKPVMAHPPLTKDVDCDLRGWLDELIDLKKGLKDRGRRLGIKLDFKSLDVVMSAFDAITGLFDEIDFPIWFNADILPGPVNATQKPGNAFTFLYMCDAHFPDSMVSVGWTTALDVASTPAAQRLYKWEHVVSMAALLHKVNSSQSRTFPVRASFVARSVDRLRWLLGVVPESTLTVWSAKEDAAIESVDDLLLLRSSLPKSKVYYDLSKSLDEEFRLAMIEMDAKRKGKTADDVGVGISAPTINDCILQSGSAVAFIKPCNNTVNVTSWSTTKNYLLRGILEFLKAPSDQGQLQQTSSNDAADDGQSLVIGVRGHHQVLVERSGLVHEVRASNIVNTTRLARSRCYAFQMDVGASPRRPPSLLHVHLWSVDCAQEEPCKPNVNNHQQQQQQEEDVFFATLGTDGVQDGINALGAIADDVGGLLLLGVDSRGDNYKVIRSFQGAHCDDHGGKLLYADQAESPANALRFNGSIVIALIYGLNLILNPIANVDNYI